MGKKVYRDEQKAVMNTALGGKLIGVKLEGGCLNAEGLTLSFDNGVKVYIRPDLFGTPLRIRDKEGNR